MQIETLCFGETQSQWKEQDMRDQFDHDFARVTVFDEEPEERDSDSDDRQGAKGAKGSILGFLLSWKAGHEFQVMRLGVEPESQRKGIGSKLMFDLLRDADAIIREERGERKQEEDEEGKEDGEAESNSLASVTLEVRESNRKAKSFYSKLGFQPIATREGYYSNGEDAIIMELQLIKGQRHASSFSKR